MKVRPLTPEACFEASRNIFANKHYKIFTPSGRYFRQKNQFIAVTTFSNNCFFLVQLRDNALHLRWLPPIYVDLNIIGQLETELAITIGRKNTLSHPYPHEWNDARIFITPSQRHEFDMLIPHVRLP